MSEYKKQKFPNSGILSKTKSRLHPKSPDMAGDITIERSLIRQLMDEQDGDDVKIKLSGWTRSGEYGDFISLVVNTYKPPVDAAAQQSHLSELTDRPPVDNSDVPF
jgi:hypothetical protein